MKIKSTRRSLTIIGLFCGIMILISLPLLAIPNNSHTNQSSGSLVETSAIEISDIEITSAQQTIRFGEYGLLTVKDRLVYKNNGSSAVTHLYYTVNDAIDSNLKYIGVKTSSGGSLSVQTSSNKLNGHKTYIIYLNNPLLPDSTIELVTTTIYADILSISGSFSTQICSFEVSVAPFVPYKIGTSVTTIYAPSGASLGQYNPEGTSTGSTGMKYERTDQDPFTVHNVTGSYTYNENPVLKFSSLTRKVYVNSWGYIRVEEQHSIQNTGNLTVTEYEWQVPKDARNITASDFIGEITGIQMSYTINADDKTKNVTMDLTDNRSPIGPKTSTGYNVEYYLPIDNYFSKDYTTAALAMDIHLLRCNFIIESEKTEIHLFAGKTIVSNSLTPDLVDFQENSMVIVYENDDLIGLESQFLYLEYKEDGFQLIYSPFIYSLIILGVLAAYVVLRTNSRGKDDSEEIREDIIPTDEIREFVTLYEEINAIRIDMKKLDTELSRRKIKKREYTKSMKMLENKLKETQDEIQSFKKFLINKGRRFADIIQKLDLFEAELIANEDGIKLHDERYRKGKLPSKRAYRTLREQMIKQGEKTQGKIDKLINELKAYLI